MNKSSHVTDSVTHRPAVKETLLRPVGGVDHGCSQPLDIMVTDPDTVQIAGERRREDFLRECLAHFRATRLHVVEQLALFLADDRAESSHPFGQLARPLPVVAKMDLVARPNSVTLVNVLFAGSGGDCDGFPLGTRERDALIERAISGGVRR